MTFLRRTLIAAATVAVASASFSAFAQDIKPRLIRFGYGLNEQSNQGRAAKVFAEQVEKASGGKMKVRAIGAAALGPDTQMQQALIGGAQEMMVGSTATLVGITKEMALWDTPFLFNNVKEADAVLDGPIGQKVMDKLQDKGLVGLAYWDLGFRQVHTGKKPIAKADDFKGMKMRVIPTPIYVEFMKSLGASPVPMAFTETYTALEQGAIDGMTNPLLNILDSKFDEVSKYLTITNHMYTPQAVVVSKKFWDKLTPAEQKLMREAAQETAVYQRKIARDEAAKVLAEIKRKGMTVFELPPEEIAKLRERSKPVVEKYTTELGPIVGEMYAAVDKARKAK